MSWGSSSRESEGCEACRSLSVEVLSVRFNLCVRQLDCAAFLHIYIYMYIISLLLVVFILCVCVCDKPFHRPIRHSRASMLMTTVWGQKCYVKEGLSLCDSAQHFLLVGKQRWVLIRAGPPSMHILWGIPKTGTQARKWENMTTWRSCSSK